MTCSASCLTCLFFCGGFILGIRLAVCKTALRVKPVGPWSMDLPTSPAHKRRLTCHVVSCVSHLTKPSCGYTSPNWLSHILPARLHAADHACVALGRGGQNLWRSLGSNLVMASKHIISQRFLEYGYRTLRLHGVGLWAHLVHSSSLVTFQLLPWIGIRSHEPTSIGRVYCMS